LQILPGVKEKGDGIKAATLDTESGYFINDLVIQRMALYFT